MIDMFGNKLPPQYLSMEIDFSELDSWCFHVKTTSRKIKEYVRSGSISTEEALNKLYDSVESGFLHIPQCFIDCMAKHEYDVWCKWLTALEDICECSSWLRTYK